MSFSGYETSSVLQTAVEHAAKAGKVLVAASGNEGGDPELAGKLAIL